MPRMNQTKMPAPPAYTQEKVDATKRWVAEAERLMPAMYGRPGFYCCKICGGLVADRGKHFMWHNSGSLLEVVSILFGVDEE